jgi:predicted SnoaL-like aldol condensation-catalyzing enzyme
MAACVCGSASGGAAPATDDNMIGLTTPNGKLVYDFVNLWFNEHKTNEAFDRYVSKEHYMNHAVYDASVNKHPSFEEEKIAEARAVPPGAHFEFKQLIAQGSLVIAHIHAFQDYSQKNDPGDEMVMILRVRDGKIVDHWDLHTQLKADSAVFAGLDR